MPRPAMMSSVSVSPAGSAHALPSGARPHALVPVVGGIGGVLKLDRLQPGVLAGGLVEVPVHADVAARVICHRSSARQTAESSCRKMTTASGGSVKFSECGLPCIGMGAL